MKKTKQTRSGDFTERQKKIANELVKKWPSVLVSRAKVGEFSGFLISGRTLANFDNSQKGGGLDSKDIYKTGAKVAYSSQALANWIVGRFIE